jgi:hypothetical protein
MKCKEWRWTKTRSWCWQSWLHVFNSDMFSVSWSSEILTYQSNMICQFSVLSVLCVIDAAMRLWLLLHNDMIEEQSLSCISVYLSLFTHYRWFNELVHQMVSFLSLLVFVEHLFINYQDDAAFSKASLCNLSSFHCLVISILESCIDSFPHSQVSRCWDQCVWRMFCQKWPVIVQIEDKTMIMIRTKSNIDEVVGWWLMNSLLNDAVEHIS